MNNKACFALAFLVACSSGKAGDDDDDTSFPPDASIGECEPASAGGFTFEKIADWADDTKAAYSFIHDDYCGAQLNGIQEQAQPAMIAAGIRSGLGAIAGDCEDNDNWGLIEQAEADGFEIVNHSYTHPQIDASNATHEIAEAKALLEDHMQGKVWFFIFPYDYFTEATIAAVQQAGHQGARAGVRDDNDGFEMPPINPATPTTDFAVEFDVWPRSYSKYALYFPEDMLKIHVYNAIERGGWAMREFHSVMPDDADPAVNGFGPITRTEYDHHLAFLQAAWKRGEVWTAPPTAVLRYRHAKTACGASVEGDTIKFDTSNPECAEFATPISVIVTTADDLPRVDGTQGGQAVKSRKLGPNRFSITADPTQGEVALTGCSNPGYEVDPNFEIDPKPTPANSVCEIETVAGTGSPGAMDNLERPAEQFQVLPNPQQADGRTGTWSWYPQAASVSIAADGASNHILHYTGNGLAAWSGATLAFLGGNGAGTCYDATQYTGIKFRIKGSVTATDELNGKVIVSLVTSETQSRRYGGDLNGEGGHFHKVVPVTSGWSTVQITFAEMEKPTWGATTGLTAVANAKLQAIDWGVSNTASTFDISIDDIELY